MSESDETKRKVGRPRKDLDWVMLDGLCGRNAPLYYCAEMQARKWGEELNKDTITAATRVIQDRVNERFGLNFLAYRDQKLNGLRLRVFDKQVELMEAGNVGAAIWLGKQLLGQREPAYEIAAAKKETAGMTKGELLRLAAIEIEKDKSEAVQ